MAVVLENLRCGDRQARNVMLRIVVDPEIERLTGIIDTRLSVFAVTLDPGPLTGVLMLSPPEALAQVNDAQTAVAELSETLSDITLRVPARSIKPGINVLSLKASGGGKATLDRLTLERDLSSGSATTPR